MMPPSSFAQLKSLRRPQLQALAKDNSLRATGTTVSLIASLAQLYGFEETPSLAPSTKSQRSGAATSKPKTIKPAPGVHVAADGLSAELPPASSEPIVVESANTRENAIAGSSSAKEAVAQGGSAARIVYGTSPETQAAIDTLLTTVNALRCELTAAQSTITELKSTVSALSAAQASRAPSLTKADILALVKQELAVLQPTLEGSSTRPTELSAGAEGVMETTNAKAKAVQHLDAEAEASTSAKEGTEKGSRDRRTTFSPRPVVTDASQEANPAVAASTRSQTAVSIASPTPSDAPPTQTLGSYSTPPTPDQTTPLRAGRTPVASHNSSLLNLASALPSHMVAHAVSMARRTPHASTSTAPSRRSPHASTSTAASVTNVASTAPSSNLGKHRRDSEASNVSIDVDRVTVTSPSRTRTPAPRGCFPTSLRSATGNDRHSRKKQKVSWDDDQHADDDDEPVASHSKDGEKEQGSLEDASENDSAAGMSDNSSESIRDYLVKTKPGIEAPAVVQATSTSTPSFAAWNASMAAFPNCHPIPSLPFPSPRRPATTATSAILTPSAFANTSNPYPGGGIFSHPSSPPKSTAKTTKTAAPPTPLAPRTLFGTERALSGFADEGVASPYKRY
ncbi:hypothetical protein JCM1841_002890 [Sporobolomyces salmonicolor]